MGAFFIVLLDTMQKVSYAKPWLNIDDQLSKLESRNLLIPDKESAKCFLRYFNYYRFAGYSLKFQEWDAKKKDRVFKPGVSFEDVRELSEFDGKIRDCFSEALEIIEISLRSCIAYHFGESYGPFGHWKAENFDPEFDRGRPSRESKTKIVYPYRDWKNAVLSETKRSSEVFVKHFEQCYVEYPVLPIWVVSEICSFGTLSKLYSNMLNAEQVRIASEYGLQHLVLKSWLHTLTYVRNLCAHHARLWDKVLQISPRLPERKNWQRMRGLEKSVFAVAIMLNWMLAHDSIDQEAHKRWKGNLESLIDSFAARFPALLSYMRFPTDWKTNPLWWQY